MKKNVASQHVACQMNSRTDGSPLTASVTVSLVKDGGTYDASGGTVTHKGDGLWDYAPTQAETNADHVAFQFIHSTGVYQVVNVYPTFPQTGDSFARLGAPAGASVSADIAAIEAQTDDIGAAGAGLTAVPWNAAWDAEVESEVNDALVVHRLDELLNADSDIDGAAPPTVGSVFHELMSKTSGSFTYDQTTDSCEAIRDKLTDIETDTAEIGAAGAGLTVLATQSLLTTVAGYLDTEIAAIKAVTDVLPNAGALTTIQSDLDNIQTRLPALLVSGRIDASIGAAAADTITASALAADAVTEIQSGLATAASIAALNNLSAAQVNTEVDTAIADARLDELLAADSDIDGAAPPTVGSVFHELLTKTAGSFTYDQTTDSLEAIRDKETDIETDTSEIGAAGAGLTAIPWNAAWDAEVQSEAEDALIAHRLDELLNADSDIDGASPPAVGSVFHELMTKTPGSFTYDQTTDSLEAQADAVGGTAPTAAEVADAVWDESMQDHDNEGSTGRRLKHIHCRFVPTSNQ